MKNEKRVIIVEDNALQADTLKTYLEGIGYSVLQWVDDAAEAVDAAWHFRPTVVLMDIKLRTQGKDGTWAARFINQFLGIPSVFITGHPENMDKGVRDALKSTFGYEPVVLTKPIGNLKKVDEAIRKVLRLQKRTKQSVNTKRKSIFVSYCQKDMPHVMLVQEILKRWASERGIQCLIDRDFLCPGDEHKVVIKNAVKTCRVALLFVSERYLASTFIREYEIPWLRAAQEDGARLIPIVVGRCDYDAIPLVKELLAVNRRSCPLEEMSIAEQLPHIARLLQKLEEWYKDVFS
jgi:CheY-like chemotaxis protein